MENTKQSKIIERCENYNKIINYRYDTSDLLTHQIINLYKTYILGINYTECELITCKILDNIVNEYLENYHFHSFIRKHYERGNIDDFIIKDKIIELYDNYQNGNFKFSQDTRWL